MHKHEDESDVLIECRDVYKSFGEKHILKGVSFKVISVLLLLPKFHGLFNGMSFYFNQIFQYIYFSYSILLFIFLDVTLYTLEPINSLFIVKSEVSVNW